MMTRKILATLMFVWGIGLVSLAQAFQTAVVFPVSSVEHVDSRNQVLTFKTQDGQVRMFRVAQSVGMKRESLAKGDLVRIEVDLDDQIVNIVKLTQTSLSDREALRRK
ncbi:MAG: hypothetical protein KF854_14975 [Nitrospira sp.]|nr:hypothetical protein [Nitrospira sp.]MBX3343193.1 hypothetical protein [Nitrospira sp.]MBX3370562.1 hypothetical protein [Nitrospira sp.]MBX7038186.1 hypothetical protein [Nitrospira sp.]MCW5794520.1 hypothetical protein [Nitrospira sp.]